MNDVAWYITIEFWSPASPAECSDSLETWTPKRDVEHFCLNDHSQGSLHAEAFRTQ